MNEDEIKFLARDDGGDDDEASRYKYSRTGSDIQMPPVSSDGAEKMRHVEIEKDAKKKLEAKPKAVTTEMMVQTDVEMDRKESREYEAPPSPDNKEYVARDSEVSKALASQHRKSMSQSIPEFVGPDDSKEKYSDLGIDEIGVGKVYDSGLQANLDTEIVAYNRASISDDSDPTNPDKLDQ